MGKTRTSKLSVIGAGAVGASTAYAALIRGSADEVALYDLNGPLADAQVLDLAHGTPFTGSTRVIGGGDVGVVADSDVVIITAGAAQRPGQTRLELVGVNAKIIRELVPALLEQAPDAVFMLVTNPVDVLTAVAVKEAGVPEGRIFGSGTTLDTARLRWLVAERAGVTPMSVNATIAGEHGDSEFPLWSTATIGGSPIREWTDVTGAAVFDNDAVLAELARAAVNSADTIISGKGATNYAIGLSAVRLAEAVIRDEKLVTPVSSVLHDYHELSDVALSVPSILGAGGVERMLPTPMTTSERAALRASAATLRSVLEEIGHFEA